MAGAIFGENSGKYAGAFRTTQDSGLTFGSDQQVTLMQNLQVSHQQPIQNLFEIGTNKRYYVVGKPSGTWSASQILGFGSAVLDQVVDLADPCTGDRTLSLAMPNSFCDTGGAQGGGITLKLSGVLLQTVGFSMAAQDNLINSQIAGLMTDFEYYPDS